MVTAFVLADDSEANEEKLKALVENFFKDVYIKQLFPPIRYLIVKSLQI